MSNDEQPISGEEFGETRETLQNNGRTTRNVRQEAEEALRQLHENQSEIERRPRQIIEGDAVLRVDVEDSAAPTIIALSEEMLIGRRDPTSDVGPEIDLTPHNGYQMGISRRHALIRFKDQSLEVLDLGSRNGTYLNGHALKPHQPVALHNGDEIRLGKIVLRVFIQPRT